ncbi:hypothetical protein AAFC00_004932 [Neodothiora populina]
MSQDVTYDKTVVIGTLESEDTAWVDKLTNWHPAVYHVENTTMPLHTAANKGREANVYLTYIIDNYDRLPVTIAFVHSHEDGYPRAWHTDAKDHSNAQSLNSLNIDFVQRNGYTNLCCIATPGCPDELQPFRQHSQGLCDDHCEAEKVYAAAWRHIFENDEVPTIIGTPSCAQFAVSREQVLERPRVLYMRAHQWLMATDLEDSISGRVFEYMWHIMFGQEAVNCYSLSQCYQDVYNRSYKEKARS